MKAPINFAEKVKGHKLKVGSLGYRLGDSGGDNNKVWIYPEGDTHNVIRMDFNWEKQYYVVNIVNTVFSCNSRFNRMSKEFYSLVLKINRINKKFWMNIYLM